MSASVEVVRPVYGFDWASVAERRAGLDQLGALISPDFESRFAPELHRRPARGIEQLAIFGEAIEQDFSEFRYLPVDLGSLPDGRLSVSGSISCTARATGLRLRAAFHHQWTLNGGRAVLVESGGRP